VANVSGYLAFFKIGIKKQIAYKADYFVSLLFRMARPLIMLAVWAVIYLNTGMPTIGGLTLAETSAYYFLAMPMMGLFDTAVIDTMQDDVQSGAIASARVKPLSYPFNVLFRSLSVGAMDILLLVAPLLIIAFLAFHITLTPTSLALFLVEALVGIATINLIGFFIGMATIRLTNVYGLASTFWTVWWIISGMTVPLSFFPTYVQNILALTPFPITCYLPIVTLLGAVSDAQIIGWTFYAFVWVVALSMLAYFWWKRVSKEMGAVGG
jgi:ABC-2 type transport system permease protein